jgi:hypothetical protein
MDHEARIQAAITELESQTRKNYTSTTKKWDLERTIISTKSLAGATKTPID